MRSNQRVRQFDGAEPTLAEELAAFGDDDVLEMTNLQEDDTGIPGVILISTAMGARGPRLAGPRAPADFVVRHPR